MLNESDIKLIHPRLTNFVTKGFTFLFIIASSVWVTWALIIGQGSILGLQ